MKTSVQGKNLNTYVDVASAPHGGHPSHYAGKLRDDAKRHRRSCCLTFSLAAAKSLQLCPTLCDPIDSSPPGSPIPGILQARTLEWVAISFSNA